MKGAWNLNKPRYAKFIILIEGIQKSIQKLKLAKAKSLGIKSVHIFWISHLLYTTRGLTAAELARGSMIDRSLVSREIEELVSRGLVALSGERRYILTEDGRKLAEEINGMVEAVQSEVNLGIDERELETFYSVLEKMYDNFNTVTRVVKKTNRNTEGENK